MKRILGAVTLASFLMGATAAKADLLTIDLTAGSTTAISSTGTWATSFSYNLDPLLVGNPTLLGSLGFGANHNLTLSAITEGATGTTPHLGRFNVGLGLCFNFDPSSCDQDGSAPGTNDDGAPGGNNKWKEVDGAYGNENEGIAISLAGAPDEFEYLLVSLTFDRIDTDGTDDALLRYIDTNGDAQTLALTSCVTAQCTVELNLLGRNFEIWATEDDDDWTLRGIQIGLDAPTTRDVPEPHAMALFGLGMLGLAALRRRRA
jgi:hypothetical protein